MVAMLGLACLARMDIGTNRHEVGRGNNARYLPSVWCIRRCAAFPFTESLW